MDKRQLALPPVRQKAANMLMLHNIVVRGILFDSCKSNYTNEIPRTSEFSSAKPTNR